MQDFLDRLGVMLVRGLVWLNSLLPRKSAGALGKLLGGFWFHVLRVRRSVASSNARRVYGPAKTRAETDAIIKAAFQHWCGVPFEMSPLLWEKREDFLRETQVHGLEHMRGAVREGKGAVLISAHYGVFPLLSACFPALGFPFHWLSRRPKNRHTRALFDSWLARTGCRIIEDVPRHVATLNCLKALGEGGSVCFLMDHHFPAGAMVPFFGCPARTALGPAMLAYRAQVPLVPVCISRIAAGKYRMVIEEAIPPPSAASREDLVDTLSRLNRRIESWILADPRQWFWIHRRWKDADSADRAAGPAAP